MTLPPLRDYGIIGNREGAALVSSHGSIDWCCLPWFDSPSHFGALLDTKRGGRFLVQPLHAFQSRQSYVDRSNVLETRFETDEGDAIVLDWMPLHPQIPAIHRRIHVPRGKVRFQISCTPRFDYGADPALPEHNRNGVLFRGNLSQSVAVLKATIPLKIGDGEASAEVAIESGQTVDLIWSFGRTASETRFLDPDETVTEWRTRAHSCPPQGCPFSGPWHDLIIRSGLVLQLLGPPSSGAIVESVTTSLPTLTGGTQNWDHRYAWILNCSSTYRALKDMGLDKEASAHFGWIGDLVLRDGVEFLQSVYTIDGGRFLPEKELGFLNGFAGSRPVRIGNHAARLFQLGLYGQVMDTFLQGTMDGYPIPKGLWPRLSEIAEFVCQAWRRPDCGPWELRSKPEHSVSSKVQCWVALDRAISLAGELGIQPPERWRQAAKTIHRTICEQGYLPSKRTFVRDFGSSEIDSGTLSLALTGFLQPEDERIVGTLNALQSELSDGPLLFRSTAIQGVAESDGASILSSLQFVHALALSKRVDEARDRLAEICTYASPLGLFSERADPRTGALSGNIPAASAHAALINATLQVSSQAAGHGLVRHVPSISACDRAASSSSS